MRRFKYFLSFILSYPVWLIILIICLYIGSAFFIDMPEIAYYMRFSSKVGIAIFLGIEILKSMRKYNDFYYFPKEYTQDFMKMYEEMEFLLIIAFFYFLIKELGLIIN